MKRNIIGAFAIMFITIAFLLVVNDLSKAEGIPAQANLQSVHQP